MTDDFTTDPIPEVVKAIAMVGPQAILTVAAEHETGADFGAACAANGNDFPWGVISRTRRATAVRIAFGIARREAGISGTKVRDAIECVGGIAEIVAVLQTTTPEGWCRAATEQADIDAYCGNEAETAAWMLLASTPVQAVVALANAT